MFMCDLAGTIGPAAIRVQPVDGVTLMKDIPHTRICQVVQIPNGLDVELWIPEEQDAQQTDDREVWSRDKILGIDSLYGGEK
jgi:hypothetical protein